MSPRLRLILAAVAFVGWIGWLAYASLTKSHAPTVSHAQAAAASAAVVIELNDEGPKATVAHKLWGECPDGTIEIPNLPGARGYAGPGKYLLLLTHAHKDLQIVGQQRSPGDSSRRDDDREIGPIIYPWSDDVRKQVEKLKPAAK